MLAGVALLSGCAPSYLYKAVTNNCNCEEYSVRGSTYPIQYVFRARYRMDEGLVTRIEIDVRNEGPDTILLHTGSVRISSRNVAYQYNNRFVPLPFLILRPGRSETLTLTGRDITGEEDWLKIAGERMTITLRGIRVKETPLPDVSVEFVPDNPKLGES